MKIFIQRPIVQLFYDTRGTLMENKITRRSKIELKERVVLHFLNLHKFKKHNIFS